MYKRQDLYGKVIALSGGMNFLAAMDTSKPEAYDAPWPWKAIFPAPYDGVGSGLDDLPQIEKKKMKLLKKKF